MCTSKKEIKGNSGIQFSDWAKSSININKDEVLKFDKLYADYKSYVEKANFGVLRKKIFRRYLKIHFRNNHIKMKTITFSLSSKIFTN